MRYAKLPIFLLVICCSAVANAQSGKAEKIEAFVAPFVKANQFAGQIVAAEGGKVIYDKAFGLANADFKVPNQPNTRIGIASVTKTMTSVILNRLIEANKISMSDKLSKYIPDFPDGDKITIEMLAQHRSGILHRVMPPEAETISYTSAEFVEKVKQAKLAFEPGTKNLYSSGGYAVLARAMEIASGRPYSQLLQEFVFSPAGMTDSLSFDGESIMERRAQDYYPAPGGRTINVPLKDYSFLVGAGSVYGSAGDVYRFGDAVVTGKLGEASKSLIRNGALTSSGSTNGHRAYLEVAGDRKYGYAITANMSGAFDTISQGIKEILEGKPLTVKYTPTPAADPNANKTLADFAGRYKRSDGVDLTILLRNDSLYGADIKLYPIKPDCFFEYRFFGEVCFTRENSVVNAISWKGVGFEFKYSRQ